MRTVRTGRTFGKVKVGSTRTWLSGSPSATSCRPRVAAFWTLALDSADWLNSIKGMNRSSCWTIRDRSYARPKNVHGQILGKADWPKGLKYYEVKVPVDDIWDDRSVIYVFGKFIDKDGKVLATKPAVFWKVGDYTRGLQVLVGPDFIKRNVEPTLDKDRERGGY